MNEKLIPIPYAVVHIPDLVEAARVEGALASKYYTKRTELSPYLKLAGGRVVNNAHELRMAVEELENIAGKNTTTPCYVTEYGTLYLTPCQQLILENGEMSENSYAYLPPNANAQTGDEVDVFFLYFNNTITSYFGRGVLMEDKIVKLNQEEVK